jgi:hypothetical protein
MAGSDFRRHTFSLQVSIIKDVREDLKANGLRVVILPYKINVTAIALVSCIKIKVYSVRV